MPDDKKKEEIEKSEKEEEVILLEDLVPRSDVKGGTRGSSGKLLFGEEVRRQKGK